MANATTIKSYLVALGIRDNLTPGLNRSLRQAQRMTGNFTRGMAMAATAMTGLFVAANVGIARFVTGLVYTDDRVRQLAQDMGTTHEEATRLHHALNTMGKSLEEIEASPELTRQFQQLQRDAAAIQIPDMREGLEQVRGIQGEFLRLRNIASHGIQWIGHHLLKYLQRPMERVREIFSGLNDRIIVSLPDWTRRIASVMATIVNLGATIVRVASNVFDVIRNVFQMIPNELVGAGLAVGAVFTFLRLGLVGKFVALLSGALLLVEDFFVWLDGGEALLGDFWQRLVDIWAVFAEGGGVERARELLEAVVGLAGTLWEAVKGVAENMLQIVFPRGTADVLDWLAGTVIPGVLGGLTDVVNKINDFIRYLNDIGALVPMIQGFIALFARNPFIRILSSLGLIRSLLALLAGDKTIGEFFSDLIDRLFEIGSSVASFATGFIEGLPGFVSSIAGKLQENWPQIRSAGEGLLNALVGGIQVGVPWLLENAAGLLTRLLNYLTENDTFSRIIGAGSGLISNLAEGATRIIPQLLTSAGNLLTQLIDTITENDTFGRILSAGGRIVSALIDGALKVVPNLITGAGTLLTNLVGAITENDTFSKIIDAGGRIVGALIDGAIILLPRLLTYAGNLLTNLLNALTENDTFAKIIGAGGGLILALIDGATNLLPRAIEGVRGLVTSLANALSDNETLAKIGAAAISLIRAAGSAIYEHGPAILETIIGFVTNLLSSISNSETLGGIIDGAISLAQRIADTVLNSLPELLSGAADLVSRILDSLLEGDNLANLLSTGAEIIVQLANGLARELPNLIARIPELINAIIDAFRDGEVISKLFEAGKEIVKAILAGLADLPAEVWLLVAAFVGLKIALGLLKGVVGTALAGLGLGGAIKKGAGGAIKKGAGGAIGKGLGKTLAKGAAPLLSLAGKFALPAAAIYGLYKLITHENEFADMDMFTELTNRHRRAYEDNRSQIQGWGERNNLTQEEIDANLALVMEDVLAGLRFEAGEMGMEDLWLAWLEEGFDPEVLRKPVEEWEQIIFGAIEEYGEASESIGELAGDFDEAGHAIEEFIDGCEEAAAILQSIFNDVNNAMGAMGPAPWTPPSNLDNPPGFATGTNNTPDTFIAGEEGPELIVGAAGRKVFTAGQTKGVFDGISEMAYKLSSLHSYLKNLDAGLDRYNQIAHNSTTTNVYNYNQQTYDLKSSYNIKDTSGRPDSVAKAVDRTKQIQLRNLQGILNTAQ